MYELFQNVNDLIFYGLAAVIIIGSIFKIVKSKKKDNNTDDKTQK